MKPDSKLVISSASQEIRVAVIENGKLAELYTQRKEGKSSVGNIFKGRVVRVLPGMQAAFVDIGLERAAFLYVTDFFEEYSDAFNPNEVDEERKKDKDKDKNTGKVQIQDVLSEGQEVLVQVAKDPIGTKGARLTSHVSIPGRHLVYMPTVSHVGVSRKIENETERKRLKELVASHKTTDGGFILRTASSGQSEQDLIADIEHLERLWKKILRRRQGMKAPALLHEDLSLIQRTVRDFYTDDIEELFIDDPVSYRQIKQFAGQFLPKKKRKITLFKEKTPIFEAMDIENQVDKALGRKVWLKSGGYLIIDQTEALTAIDVNTGRYVGSSNLEETILKTNLEAVREIVAQLRLRNIGGLIILDVIDMDRRAHRDKVFRALEDAVEDDRARTNILQISELGLIEMTRKRTRENLRQMLCEPCVVCDGKGYHESRKTVAYKIIRKVTYELENKDSRRNIEIVAHPTVASILKTEEYDTLVELENKAGRSVVIREQMNLHPAQFEINFTGQEFISAQQAVKAAAADSTAENAAGLTLAAEDE